MTIFYSAFALSVVSISFSFVINNFLIYWLNFPEIFNLFIDFQEYNNDLIKKNIFKYLLQLVIYFAPLVYIIKYLLQLFIYFAPLICIFKLTFSNIYTIKFYSNSLKLLSAYIIRTAFYIVLVVGLVDYIISFLRVEGLLKILLTDKFALNLGISSFRGTYIHLPIIVICSIISLFIKENLSFKWLSFMIVISEFLIVITRFIFSYEQSFMSDLVRMWYSALFLFASSHALITEGHVRVDVLYSQMKKKKQSLMNMIGCIFLGIPLCWTILGCGLWTKYSSINSSLISFEVYQQGFGMYVKYIMVGFLLIFALSMIVQFMAYFLDNVRIYLVPKED